MEAAHITWRPLGRLLVEQGLLSDDELEQALAKQQETGERLGETIVKCGFVSGPQLAAALAAQYGIELTTEKGFGTGLRSEIQRRHESDRRRIVQLVPDPPPYLEAVPSETEQALEEEPDADRDETPSAEALLLAQLEEQWAKLAAAEAALAERERELQELTVERGRDAEERHAEWAKLNAAEAELAERERELHELTEARKRDGHGREEEWAKLAAAEAELAERQRELAERDARRDHDLHMLEELNERLREQVGALLSEPEPEEPTAVAPTSHLVFVQLDERYELVSRDGPPPEPSTPLFLPDVDEGSFVVAGSRRSPFPGDARPCVVAERALPAVQPS